MANRTWRNELNRSFMYTGGGYGGNQMNYQNIYNDRRGYGGNRGGYREENKRGKRDFHNRYEPTTPKKNIHENNTNQQSAVRRNYNNIPQTIINKKPISKYSVKAPKVVYDLKEGSISLLRARYSKLYIPSDFFHSDFRWQEVFPISSPMKIMSKTSFQVFHRDIEPLVPFINEEAEPSDANYIYSAKVMLISSPEMVDIIKSICEGESDMLDNNQYKTLNKTLHFLVGSKGKNEPMAIGGPWSASLDGLNPDEDPKVLIRTAMRTCKQLTGIDLSPCREWYRFIEFHYYRPADRQGTNISCENDENRNETELDFRVETVVLFIPSIWDCMPDSDSWDELKKKYSNALENIINPPIPEPTVEIIDTDEKKETAYEKVEEEKLKDDIENKVVESLENPMEIEDKLVDVDSTVTNTTNTGNITEISNDIIDKIENKELSDKDKKRFERLYKMNDCPSIVVHTNKAAKNGKFDCQLVSLHSLLEYRSDDQKENTFEVSVFAEQFNEMLQRDAAFKIYKTLLSLPTPPEQQLEKIEGEPDAKRKREESMMTGGAGLGADSTRSSDLVAQVKEKSSLDSETLMKFCVFDVDHAGYIKEHDMEEILHSIGLDLSRSQTRKLMAKAMVSNKRGGVYYRELNVEVDHEFPTDEELSKGNKSKLLSTTEESTIYLDNETNTLAKIKSLDSEIKEIENNFNSIKSELESIRAHYHTSKDMENHLRSELKSLESKLYIERKNVREASQLQDIYNGLLRMSRDVLERAKSKIDRQFEKDAEKEQGKAEMKKPDELVVNGN